MGASQGRLSHGHLTRVSIHGGRQPRRRAAGAHIDCLHWLMVPNCRSPLRHSKLSSATRCWSISETLILLLLKHTACFGQVGTFCSVRLQITLPTGYWVPNCWAPGIGAGSTGSRVTSIVTALPRGSYGCKKPALQSMPSGTTFHHEHYRRWNWATTWDYQT